MAYQKVATQRKYFKYAECQKGQKLVDEGVYLGTEEGKFGIQHIFRQKDGETVVLNKSGHLDYLLAENATKGTKCNVIYDGKIVLTKGPFKGKEANNFELEVDDAGPVAADKIPAAIAHTDDLTL